MVSSLVRSVPLKTRLVALVVWNWLIKVVKKKLRSDIFLIFCRTVCSLGKHGTSPVGICSPPTQPSDTKKISNARPFRRHNSNEGARCLLRATFFLKEVHGWMQFSYSLRLFAVRPQLPHDAALPVHARGH